ncbi:TetR family transcriptional regulator [Salinimonas marina]|uniref:TetR family transcriptional regulator n=1 Tax=Salinimonas marina TaxID=2785918 RepID=UPI001C5525D5
MTLRSGQKPESARARLLAAAAILFYKNGITATGIDSIIKQAGVAKKVSTIILPRRPI